MKKLIILALTLLTVILLYRFATAQTLGGPQGMPRLHMNMRAEDVLAAWGTNYASVRIDENGDSITAYAIYDFGQEGKYELTFDGYGMCSPLPCMRVYRFYLSRIRTVFGNCDF